MDYVFVNSHTKKSFMPPATFIGFYKIILHYYIKFGLSSAWNAVQLIYAIVAQIS